MRKGDNRGFSLVELLIALAVAGIILSALVMLIHQSVRSYSKQSVSAQLQNDADITLNQVENDLMEATTLIMCNQGTKYDYYLTKVSAEADNKYYGYIWDKDNKILYYSTDYNPSSELALESTNASVVCEHVSDFSIKISSECVRETQQVVATDVAGAVKETKTILELDSNINVKVKIKLENLRNMREVTRSVSLRNSIFGKDMRGDIYIKIPDKNVPVKMIDYTMTKVSSYID
ncbi:MAG: type II secretion system protein [Eubacteriales bacterium]|nr:type II secretion system protein [Eubacteriales bacterium]